MLPDIINGSNSVIKNNNVVKIHGVGENRSYSSIAFAQPKGRMNFGTSNQRYPFCLQRNDSFINRSQLERSKHTESRRSIHE